MSSWFFWQWRDGPFLGKRPNAYVIQTKSTSPATGRYKPRARRTSVVHAPRSQPLDMRLELFDLRFQALPMRAVFCCVDRFTLEGGMFEPQGIDLATKPIVLGLISSSSLSATYRLSYVAPGW
jgi:hypothetical protein